MINWLCQLNSLVKDRRNKLILSKLTSTGYPFCNTMLFYLSITDFDESAVVDEYASAVFISKLGYRWIYYFGSKYLLHTVCEVS